MLEFTKNARRDETAFAQLKQVARRKSCKKKIVGELIIQNFVIIIILHSLQLVGCGWKRMEERRKIEDLRRELRDRTQEVKINVQNAIDHNRSMGNLLCGNTD